MDNFALLFHQLNMAFLYAADGTPCKAFPPWSPPAELRRMMDIEGNTCFVQIKTAENFVIAAGS